MKIFGNAQKNLLDNLEAEGTKKPAPAPAKDALGENPEAIPEDMSLEDAVKQGLNPLGDDTALGQDPVDPNIATADKTSVQPDNAITKDDLDSFKNSILEELKSKIAGEPRPEEASKPVGEQETIEQKDIDEAERIMSLPDDELRDLLIDSPKETLAILTKAGVEKELSSVMPILQELKQKQEDAKYFEEQRNMVAEFAQDKPDFQELAPVIAEIIQKDGLHDNPSKFEIAYYKAKALAQDKADLSRKTLEEFMGDEESMSQIASDPKVQDKIISDYLKKVAKGEAEPRTITNDDGSPAVGSAGKDRPSSFKDAADRLLRRL